MGLLQKHVSGKKQVEQMSEFSVVISGWNKIFLAFGLHVEVFWDRNPEFSYERKWKLRLQIEMVNKNTLDGNTNLPPQN
jgi:hypothetical protein